ncbi:prolyl aminopeptidase [Legionella pneumophila]|uniref:prolyl aminopeptidase n=1 Tax=Legionella pneumophila TaxID=446 RepID=UPI0004878A2F|nr:prolyl aminopeptidase [Legionella pneumophila]RYW94170.1 prolyl aminopeptidase [Legionella pneumophila]STX99277.1 proline iminopeptidase [Legionella pneumophila]HAT1774153.1 prolyl aminopeptidase [Legionella pneumophila]HAT1777355.1 prolyl aminopeptidase [Legionella pneumophila]HAT2017842.1 prolyl aminopeptidase [Legionella pneumophila]
MHTLYPAIKPYTQHELKVSKLHTLYLEETGNPEGIPVIVLHHGPGGEADPHLRRFFDPQRYRIILFDQRGCGRSIPHLEISENNTQLLMEDIDSIRDFLGLREFVLFGGGWGSLLALLYAQKFPQQVKALLLHQIFLGRQKDIDWFYKHGASLVYPDYWEEFTNTVPENKLDNIPKYYAECLQGPNELARMAAAKNWALWQARCSSLQPHLYVIDQYSDPHFALALATLESYYIINHYFIEENQIIANAHKIRHIPTYIVHGRFDLVSPLSSAWELHQAIPASNLRIVRDAGHSDRESGIIDALIYASKDISKQGLDAC